MERGYVNLKRERGLVIEQAQVLEQMIGKVNEIVRDARIIRGGDTRKMDEIHLSIHVFT